MALLTIHTTTKVKNTEDFFLIPIQWNLNSENSGTNLTCAYKS